jgi:hypothetical protein
MAPPWRILPLFLLFSSVLASSHSFENTAIVRTIDLGGSVVHVTTTYAIKALEDGLKTYTVALGKEEKAKTSWLEVTVKGERKALAIKEHEIDDKKYVTTRSFFPYTYSTALNFVGTRISLTSSFLEHFQLTKR